MFAALELDRQIWSGSDALGPGQFQPTQHKIMKPFINTVETSQKHEARAPSKDSQTHWELQSTAYNYTYSPCNCKFG